MDIYSTCCYCDILLRYAKHLCFKSVLCSSTWMSHRRLCLILVDCTKGDRISIYVLGFLSSPPRELFQILVKKGQYRLSSTWWCSVLWDVVLLVLVLFWINVELKLLNCCLLPLSEQKLFQPRHDACFFVTTKLYITPFISRWKHMLLLHPLSPGNIYVFC